MDDKIHGEKYWVYREDQMSGKFVRPEGYRTENEIAITNNKGITIRYDNLGCDERHPWCIPTRRFQHVAVAYRQPS